MSIVNKISETDIVYKINGETSSMEIILPIEHKLPEYQNWYKKYDRNIGKIARIIFNTVGGTGIDIGANVGDTATAIRVSTKMPLLCIEGDSFFFSYLEQNTKLLDAITIVKAFVGSESKTVIGSVARKEGTARIIPSVNATNVTISSLAEILHYTKIMGKDISLLKIDTDGYDFEIILGSKSLISEIKPSIFFEYEVNSSEQFAESIEVIEYLQTLGYTFIIFDNYGNFLCSVEENFVKNFKEINSYIKSSLLNGGGIYYIDVFATTHSSIFSKIYNEFMFE